MFARKLLSAQRRSHRLWQPVCLQLLLGCTALFTYPEPEKESGELQCTDGSDNDLDGALDCADPGCAAHCLEDTAEACQDQRDNDRDGSSDCRDDGCAAFCPEADRASCADRVDNDFDGLSDCADTDCDGFCPEASVQECNDGRDNDGDGLMDGGDPRCWLHQAPAVQRCGERKGVKLRETFDAQASVASRDISPVPAAVPIGEAAPASLLAPSWFRHGDWAGPIGPVSVGYYASRQSPSRNDRQDGAYRFRFNTTSEALLADNLATLTRREPFSGAWSGFELSFVASVPPGTVLRAGIVPAELAPAGDAPLQGAESALLAITLDAASTPPTLSLVVEGARRSVELPLERSLCSGVLCPESFASVRVSRQPTGFVAVLERAEGGRVELAADGPSTLELPAARLVFWGGSTTQGQYTALDDVSLDVASDQPCGFSAPQMSGNSCNLGAYGQTVSVARAPDGEYCALVSVGDEEAALAARALSSWSSPQGEVWSVVSTEPSALALPAGASLVGAAISREGDHWLATVLHRSAQAAQLSFARAARCGEWSPLLPGPTIFADAEAPSHVRQESGGTIYFTRPPTDQTGRTLWRLRSTSPPSEVEAIYAEEPEVITELPLGVGAPVSVQAVGAFDRVLAYPSEAGAWGIGLLVSDASGSNWDPVEPAPLLASPLRAEAQLGQLEFDDHGVRSAALAWAGDRGFLLYGGESRQGWPGSSRFAPTVSAGTARLMLSSPEQRAADPEPPEAPRIAAVPLAEGWQIPADSSAYWDAKRAALSWVAGTQPIPSPLPSGMIEYPADIPAGATLRYPLPGALAADFELSFDLWLSALGALGGCGVELGLGSAEDAQALIIVAGNYDEDGTYTLSFGPEGQSEPLRQPFEGLQHLALRRRGDLLSLSSAQPDACEAFVETRDSSPQTSFVSLFIRYSNFCDVTSAGTLSNLRLGAGE